MRELSIAEMGMVAGGVASLGEGDGDAARQVDPFQAWLFMWRMQNSGPRIEGVEFIDDWPDTGARFGSELAHTDEITVWGEMVRHEFLMNYSTQSYQHQSLLHQSSVAPAVAGARAAVGVTVAEAFGNLIAEVAGEWLNQTFDGADDKADELLDRAGAQGSEAELWIMSDTTFQRGQHRHQIVLWDHKDRNWYFIENTSNIPAFDNSWDRVIQITIHPNGAPPNLFTWNGRGGDGWVPPRNPGG